MAVNTRLQIVQQDLERKTDQTTEDRVNQSGEGTYLNVLEDSGALEPSLERWWICEKEKSVLECNTARSACLARGNFGKREFALVSAAGEPVLELVRLLVASGGRMGRESGQIRAGDDEGR